MDYNTEFYKKFQKLLKKVVPNFKIFCTFFIEV